MKTYTKGDLKVNWQPDKCIHSAHCAKELGAVFNPQRKPWIDLDQATKERIIDQVKRCPSGALSYQIEQEKSSGASGPMQIDLMPNGPAILKGEVSIKMNNGEVKQEKGPVALCRCGFSSNKPYCDGSHKAKGFEG